jgi:O-methyltransferase involved in polyketide biosynthesis
MAEQAMAREPLPFDIDFRKPNIARVYDAFLGGKDNFSADRDLADQMTGIAPLVPVIARENRQFLARAVTWAASQGVSQFIDVGCGLPTTPNTLESAREVIADARVAYVDNDPVVLSHLNALVAKGDAGVTVVAGDAREVPVILDGVSTGIDLSVPVCLVMGYLLHFFPAGTARDLVAAYTAALAPGSSLVLSAIHVDRAGAEKGFDDYSTAVAQVYNHSVAEFTSFLGPLEVVPPGVVDARRWRTWTEAANLAQRKEYAIVGVARV